MYTLSTEGGDMRIIAALLLIFVLSIAFAASTDKPAQAPFNPYSDQGAAQEFAKCLNMLNAEHKALMLELGPKGEYRFSTRRTFSEEPVELELVFYKNEGKAIPTFFFDPLTFLTPQMGLTQQEHEKLQLLAFEHAVAHFVAHHNGKQLLKTTSAMQQESAKEFAQRLWDSELVLKRQQIARAAELGVLYKFRDFQARMRMAGEELGYKQALLNHLRLSAQSHQRGDAIPELEKLCNCLPLRKVTTQAY